MLSLWKPTRAGCVRMHPSIQCVCALAQGCSQKTAVLETVWKHSEGL